MTLVSCTYRPRHNCLPIFVSGAATGELVSDEDKISVDTTHRLLSEVLNRFQQGRLLSGVRGTVESLPLCEESAHLHLIEDGIAVSVDGRQHGKCGLIGRIQ